MPTTREIAEVLWARCLEAEIDHHVYALYGLTADEIKLVEGSEAGK